MLRAIDEMAQANVEAGDTEIMHFIEEKNTHWELISRAHAQVLKLHILG